MGIVATVGLIIAALFAVVAIWLALRGAYGDKDWHHAVAVGFGGIGIGYIVCCLACEYYIGIPMGCAGIELAIVFLILNRYE